MDHHTASLCDGIGPLDPLPLRPVGLRPGM